MRKKGLKILLGDKKYRIPAGNHRNPDGMRYFCRASGEHIYTARVPVSF